MLNDIELLCATGGFGFAFGLGMIAWLAHGPF
jgi:hypothetical protein